MYYKTLPVVLSLVFVPCVAWAEKHDHKHEHEETRQGHVHEHGVSALKIAIEGKQIEMELEAPGHDIVGFEHEAKSDEDKAAVEKAIKLLKQPLSLISFPAKAGCKLASSEVEVHKEGEEGHAEFHVHWEFTCTDMNAITPLQTKIFSQFPNMEEIDIEAISEKGQTAIELEKGAVEIDLSAVVGS